MPFEIKLEQVPAGYALESKAKGAPGPLKVLVTAIISFEEGERLVRVLEDISASIISKLPKESGITESRIDHLLAIIRKDRTATVYINELNFIATAQSKKAMVNVGDPLTPDDIADIQKMRIDGITIPDDAGIILIISSRWRRAAFFDYYPIVPGSSGKRTFDIEKLWGALETQLLFQERFKIYDSDWSALFSQEWFPFISLGSKRINDMLAYIRAGWDIGQMLDDIEKEVKTRIPALQTQIAKRKCFDGHRMVFQEAIDNFNNSKYISASGLLYPRIEGVMRNRLAQIAPDAKPKQENLSQGIVADPASSRHELSLLMPVKFQQYIEQVYFAHFDPKNVSAVSRNTVSHGVVPEKMLADKKAAVLGVLILEQLAFLCAE